MFRTGSLLSLCRYYATKLISLFPLQAPILVIRPFFLPSFLPSFPFLSFLPSSRVRYQSSNQMGLPPSLSGHKMATRLQWKVITNSNGTQLLCEEMGNSHLCALHRQSGMMGHNTRFSRRPLWNVTPCGPVKF